MKKTFLAAAVALFTANVAFANGAGGVAAAATSYTGPYDGIIKFTGSVINQTCVVNTNSKEQTVALDKVPLSALSSKGKVAGNKAFAITLTSCTQANYGVRAEFQNSNLVDVANNYTLKNNYQASNGKTKANHVNLQLKDVDGRTIAIGDAKHTGKFTTASVNTRETRLDYAVQYYATGTATEGEVASEVQYSIVYQ